ncbi:hypothetical protein BBL07_13035 [Agrobacterium vitis]|nr:hypothetical protein BBL07_13035 [Agrobacterium vitis]
MVCDVQGAEKKKADGRVAALLFSPSGRRSRQGDEGGEARPRSEALHKTSLYTKSPPSDLLAISPSGGEIGWWMSRRKTGNGLAVGRWPLHAHAAPS